MKRIISAAIAVLMIACCTGCAKENAPAETESTRKTTEAAAETTKKSEETTTAKATEAQTEAETTAETEAVTEAAPEEDAVNLDGNLTEAVIKKINSWDKGNVIIETNYTEEGNSVTIYISSYGDKSFADMDLAGLFRTKTISDGDKTYLISDTTKTYCVSTSESESEADETVDEFLIDENESGNMTDKGKDTVDGKEYTYEEFDSDSDGEKLRYYFDDSGKLCYIGAYEDGVLKIMEFKVTFLDSPDESIFKVPEGYTEISEDEMALQMFAEMFGAIGSLYGDGTEGLSE